jgi:hypothetical protein
MYSKIGSPGGSSSRLQHAKKQSPSPTAVDNSNKSERRKSREELRRKLKEHALTSASGTASVLEVIEPTSSEEEEFRQSMREMNLSWAKASTSYKDKSSSSPQQQQSPTKRLLEMGIPAAALISERTVNNNNKELVEKRSFFHKIAKWKKKGKKEDEEGEGAEEHVLPDNFEEEDDDEEERSHSLTILKESSSNKGFILHRDGSNEDNRKSLSPSSRKSLYGSKTTLAVSVATSEDSGIVVLNRAGSVNSSGGNHNASPIGTLEPGSKLGKIEEVSVSSASRSSSTVQEVISLPQENHRRSSNHHQQSLTPLSLLRKKSLEAKAWYDVPSDDERDPAGASAPVAAEMDEEEADSLASIISIRGGSSDDD